MNRSDFVFYLLAWPFAGGFISYIIGNLLHTGSASIGVMIVLGAIGGYIALLTYIIGLKATGDDEEKRKLQ